MYDVFYIGKAPGVLPHEMCVESILHAQTLSRTRYFWILNYLVDYKQHDFLYEPKPWESTQRHAFGSVWQKDSGTYLIPKQGYTDTHYHNTQLRTYTDMTLWDNTGTVKDFDYTWHPDYSSPAFLYKFGTQWQKTGGPIYAMPGAKDDKYVSQSNSLAVAVADIRCSIAHTNAPSCTNIDKTFRFFDTYLGTLKRIANYYSNKEYIWITSDCCDYSSFDFSWHPETWQNQMLHVFASNEQKFGDTFFMHVPTFTNKIQEFELLEWYDLNFVDDIIVPRTVPNIIKHNSNSHVNEIAKHAWPGHYALFTTQHTINLPPVPTMPLWRSKTRAVVPLTSSGSTTLIPKDAVAGTIAQLYDYPYVDLTFKNYTDTPLDIVFISNGETNAEANYNALQRSTSACSNRVMRIDGVNGRVAAYHAAAKASNTPWFFAVFAKLEVESNFNWQWQPDFLQSPKHYIFHARNPINGLEYGHMAMIAYNKELVLANNGHGLDFTLDNLHEVVPILSGTAHYAVDPWMAWRTAFRETLKLLDDNTTIENQYRLKCWLTATGNHDWSAIGANNAQEFYTSVDGNFEDLKKSYDWAWLKQHFTRLHKKLLDQQYTQLQDQ